MRTIPTIARRLNARNPRGSLPALLAMSDRLRLPDPIPLLPCLPTDAALIHRDGVRDSAATALRDACRRRGIPFIWAGSAADTLVLDADGLHLRDDASRRARQARAWRRHRPHALLTAAAHGPRALRAAAALGVDAVLLSPVFPTASHPGDAVIGITRFRLWARTCPCPVYALGGVTPRTARALFSTDCIGIAGIDWALSL